MAKTKKETVKKNNLERQHKWRKQKKADGFVARTYWVPKSKVNEVKRYIESLAS